MRPPIQTFILESDLLSRIPLSARTILDVGCGRGHRAIGYNPGTDADCTWEQWRFVDCQPLGPGGGFGAIDLVDAG